MRRLLAAAGLGVALLLGTAPAALADPAGDDPGRIAVTVTVPDRGAQAFTVSDAQLRWSLSTEAGSGAYFGGCHFLMAGVPGADGDTHGGRVWTATDGFYRAVADDVRVEKPGPDGAYAPASWDTRCTARDGSTVTTANGLTTETQVVLEGGRGTVDPATGTAQVRWTGTFTVVLYGGLTYWWASDPVLTVAADGRAQLTATAGGFGTAMDDQSRWEALPATTVVLADLSGVDVGGDLQGFRAVPAYRGVAVEVPAGATPQLREGADWGAFPQSFVDFQQRTGQAAYWYSSGGQADARKPATAMYVSYDADRPLTPVDERPAATAAPASGSSLLGRSGGSGGGRGTAAASAGDVLAAPALPAVPGVTALTVGRAAPGLVPAAATAGAAGERAAWGMTGLLLAGSGTVIGFRRGWLVLPWR
ncbi:hypothetical protein [Cellulomonas endometrii]|uniref:hypothetical protein n=1 Tax=Cellulomonas endometrii TaxID=3036301 RepID=UPI0024AD8D5F|nr:hypothetical protein [Cellulomonas endometrii]